MSDLIFGYEWSDINRAQQGGQLARRVDLSKQDNNAPTEADLVLLAQHGSDGLRAKQFHGTIYRLELAGKM